jgi:hypothetical protein
MREFGKISLGENDSSASRTVYYFRHVVTQRTESKGRARGTGSRHWPLSAVFSLLYLGSGIGLTVVYLLTRVLGRGPREAHLRSPDLPWMLELAI